MEDFENVDVFIPDEMHKAMLKMVYNIFCTMIEIMAKQLENQTYENGLLMMDYAPIETFIPLMAAYGIQFYYDEKTETLYLVLVFMYKDSNGEIAKKPLVYINVSANQSCSIDCYEAAYLFMVAFVQHIGKAAFDSLEYPTDQDSQ